MFFLRWVPFKETLPQLGNGRFCLNDWHAVVPRRLAPAYWLRWQLLRDGCGDLRCEFPVKGKHLSLFIKKVSKTGSTFSSKKQFTVGVFNLQNNNLDWNLCLPFLLHFVSQRGCVRLTSYQDFAMDASYWAGGAFGGCAPCVPWIWQLFSARGEKISRSYVVLKTLFLGLKASRLNEFDGFLADALREWFLIFWRSLQMLDARYQRWSSFH